MTTSTITGSVTRAKLETWLETNRPHLALHEEPGLDTKGYYRRDLGPAASFHKCGSSWREVAGELNAIEITEQW